MTSTTVARNVVTGLRDLGVRHIFGVPSGGWVDYMEAIRTTDGIDFVLASHEAGAGFMADVCGRLTGVPGVCFGTFGPGATNLATGVGGATRQHLVGDRRGLADADILELGLAEIGVDPQAIEWHPRHQRG